MTQLLTSSADHFLADLVEELSQKLAEGSSADVEAFLAGHAEHAEKLRPLIPTLQMLVEMGSSPVAAGGSRADRSEVVGHEANGHPVLGDFRILREVGRGGMGVVYEAEQISLRRRVALKVLPTAAMLDPRALQRFRNEAQAAAALHHSQIVPIFGVGCERGVHYYAMQFIDGLTLAEVITALRGSAGLGQLHQPEAAPPTAPPVGRDSNPVPVMPSDTDGIGIPSYGKSPSATETDVLAALSTEKSRTSPAWFRRIAEQFAQVAEALHHAHEVGVTHRDIKPANLMLDRLGHIWITDFGLARIEGEGNLTMTGDLVGTLRYMSPEQALVKRTGIDHRTDIYSLGITLYELLTLHPALPGHGRQELLRQIAFEEPKPPRKLNPAIPRDLETIVLKMIEKNPVERYQTAAELAADLERFVGDRHIEARRPSLYVRASRWMQRHQAAVGSAGVVLALAFVALAVGLAFILQQNVQLRTAVASAKTARSQADENWQQSLKTLNDIQELQRAHSSSDPAMESLNMKLLPLIAEHFRVLNNVNDAAPDLRHEYCRHFIDNNWLLVGRQDASATRQVDEAFLLAKQNYKDLPHDSRSRSNLAKALYFKSVRLKMSADIDAKDNEKARAELGALQRFCRELMLQDSEPLDFSITLSSLLFDEYQLLLEKGDRNDAKRLEWMTCVRDHLTSRLSSDMMLRDSQVGLLYGAGEEFGNAQRWAELESLLRRAVTLGGEMPVEDQIRASPPVFFQAGARLVRVLHALQREQDAAIVVQEVGSRLETVLDYKGFAVNRGSFSGWLVQHAGLLELLHLDSEAARIRELAMQVANQEVARQSQALTISPRPYEMAVAQSRQLCDQGKFGLAQSIARRGWWDAEGYTMLTPANRENSELPLAARQPSVMRPYIVNARSQLLLSRIFAEKAERESGDAKQRAREQLLQVLPGNASPVLGVLAEEWGSSIEWALTENNVAWTLANYPDEKLRDPEVAMHLAETAVQRFSARPNFWNTLGVARYRAGKYQESITALKKSVELSGEGVVQDWLFLAMAHFQIGDREAGMKWLDKGKLWIFKWSLKDKELDRFLREALELASQDTKAT